MNTSFGSRVAGCCFSLLLGWSLSAPAATPAAGSSPKLAPASKSASLFSVQPEGPGLHANLDLGVGWQQNGEMGFTIVDELGVLSRLTYPLDGRVAELRGGLSYQAKWWEAGVRGSYIRDMQVEGRSLDEDFLDFPGVRSDYSYSDTTVNEEVWDADAVVSALPFAGMAQPPLVLKTLKAGVSVGYGSQYFDFYDKNLDANYNYGSDIFSERGPVADYAVTFTGLRVGASLSTQPCRWCTVYGDFVFIPDLKAESDAIWLLRDYPFQQSAEGSGTIFTLGARFAVMRHVSLFASASRVSLIADKKGLESGIADGTDPYTDVPLVGEITAEYTRFDAGVSVSL